MLGIGIALDLVFADANALGGAVTPLGALRRARIELLNDGLVHVAAKRALDSLKVWACVRADLDPARQPRCQIIYEGHRRFAGPIADAPARNELRIRVERNLRPNVASTFGSRLIESRGRFGCLAISMIWHSSRLISNGPLKADAFQTEALPAARHAWRPCTAFSSRALR